MEACPLWKCCFPHVFIKCHYLITTILTLYHKIHELFYLWCQTKLDLQEKLCNKCPGGNSFETAVIVILLTISGFTWNNRAPGGPVTFWWPMWGQRLPKLQNVPIWIKCAKTAKKVQSSKSPKITKNSTFRVKPGIWKGVCVRVFCECQSVNPRPRQAQEPCPAFPSLLQLTPARSGPRSLAQLPKGPGRVPSIQGASQRSYKAQESFSVPRDVSR